MASTLEDIIQKVSVAGSEDVIGSFESIASAGTKAFGALAEASGLSEIFGGLTLGLGALAVALVAVTVAAAKFVDSQNEAQVALGALAEATGSTRDEIKGMESAFAEAGIGAETFARSTERMAVQIANSWSSIAQSMRNAGIEQQKIDEQITSSQISVAEAYNKTKFAAEEASSVATKDDLSVRGAELSLQSAQADLYGDKVTKSFIQQQQKQFSVEQASQRLSDAQLGQRKDQAQAPLTEQKINLDLSKAITEQSTAQQASYDHMTRDLDAILDALKGGGKLNLADVAPEKIKEAITGEAGTALGRPPTQQELDFAISRHLQQDNLSSGQEQAVVRAFRGGRGAETAQEVQAYKTPGAFTQGIDRATQAKLGGTDEQQATAQAGVAFKVGVSEGADNVKRSLGLGAEDFISKISSGISEIFSQLPKSTDTSQAPSDTTNYKKADSWIPSWLSGNTATDTSNNAEGGLIQSFRAGGLVRGFADGGAPAFESAPDDIKSATEADNIQKQVDFNKTLERPLTKGEQAILAKYEIQLKRWHEYLQAREEQEKAGGVSTPGDFESPSARGGPIFGPGTSTSDSIPARLSRGEFVIKAAAVSHYGQGFFHALNSMSLEGFASGGLVPRVARQSVGNSGTKSRALNLTIGERTYRGLTAPENVAKSLIQHAVDSQISTAGRKPSWYR